MQPVMDGAAAKDTDSSEENTVSPLGGCFEDTPLVVPTRGHLESIGKLMRGDLSGTRVAPEKTGAQHVL